VLGKTLNVSAPWNYVLRFVYLGKVCWQKS
jgi:hypothetical protein